MKKLILPILILSLALAACGSARTSDNSSTNGSDPAARSLPPTTQLAIGIFKLDGTDQAVTAEQAAELLPLWQVYSSLSQSDTAAQAEIDALVEQLQGTMTQEQTKAIADMQLTQQDAFALMQERGITMGAGPQASGTQTSGGSGFVPGGPEGMPDGGMPPGGGGMPGGDFPGSGPDGGGAQGTRPEVSGTPQARGGGMDRIPTALLDALIKFLKEKAGS